jgi:transcription antitermination factor NusG
MNHLHSVCNSPSSASNLFSDASSPASSKTTYFPWFGVRTRSNHEKLTANALSGKGFDQYLPTYKSRKRWSDRIVETDRPLFPGYVFCRFDPKVRLPILTTAGVVAVVGFGNEPAPIDDDQIEAVQAVLRSGLNAEPCSYLSEGQRIRVKLGSLAGLEGLLLRKKSEWRMIVSVAMLQRAISVEIDRDWIEAIRN